VATGLLALSAAFGIQAATTQETEAALRYKPNYLRVTRQGNQWFDADTAGYLEGALGSLCSGVALRSDESSTPTAIVKEGQYEETIRVTHWPIVVVRVSADWFSLTGQRLLDGRFFTEEEAAQGKAVCVVGAAYAEPKRFGPVLYQDRPPLRVGDVVSDPEYCDGEWKVVGILQPTGEAIPYPKGAWGQNDDMIVFIPSSSSPGITWTGPSELAPAQGFSLIVAYPEGGDERVVAENVRQALAGVTESGSPVIIETPDPLTIVRARVQHGVSRYFVAAAAFLLALACLQVVNAAMEMVFGRTRVLGIHRSLGASQWQIGLTVVGWCMRVASAGGLVGLGLGYWMTPVISSALGYAAPWSWAAFVRSLGYLGAFCFLGSVYPAVVASSLDPIVAIREGRAAGKSTGTVDPRFVAAWTAVSLGVGAAMLLASFGQGTQAYIDSYLRSCGEHTLVVREADPFTAQGPVVPVDGAMLSRLEGLLAGTARLWFTSTVYTQAEAPATGRSTGVYATAVGGSFWANRDFQCAAGELLAGGGGVVVGARTATELFGGASQAVGQVIRVADSGDLVVTGVLRQRPSGQLDPEVDRDVAVFMDDSQAVTIPSFAALGPENRIWVEPLGDSDTVREILAGELCQRSGQLGVPVIQGVLDEIGDLEVFRAVLSRGVLAMCLLGLAMGTVCASQVLGTRALRRTREFAIRRSLGATRRSIVLLVGGQGLAFCLLGGAAGIVAAAFLASLLSASNGWPLILGPVWAGSGLMLSAAMGLLASVLPALRSVGADPILMLRRE